MASEYSLSNVLERMYQNQLALEAALMELTLHVETQGSAEVGNNVRGALWVIGENAVHIKQGLARLKKIP
jgi:fructose-specific phosphotransferase system component IIB